MEFWVGESRLLAGSWAVARLPRTVAAWGWCVEVVKAGEVGVGVVGVVDAQLAQMAVLVAGQWRLELGWLVAGQWRLELGWQLERQWQEGTSGLVSETGLRGSPSFPRKLH